MENSPFKQKYVHMAIDHMNEDHRKDMVDMIKALANVNWVSDAEMLAFDTEKVQLKGFGPGDKTEVFDLFYGEPVTKPQAFRPMLVNMVRKSRAILAEREDE